MKLLQNMIMVMLPLVIGVNAKAIEQYDETNLPGLWEVVEKQGTTLTLKWIEGEHGDWNWLYLGDMLLTDNNGPIFDADELPSPDEIDYGYHISGISGFIASTRPDANQDVGITWDIKDFFISNGNKLHLTGCDGWDGVLRFVIEEFADNTLKIKSYDGNMTATLKRVESSVVKQVIADNNTGNIEEVYTISGMKAGKNTKGIRIVRRNSKTTKEFSR